MRTLSAGKLFLQRDFPRFLVLVGGFYVGGTIAIGLHELGHLFGACVSNIFLRERITISGLVLHPFRDSHLIASGHQTFLFAAGGFLFGSLLALICLLPAHFWSQPGESFWIIAYFVASMGVGLNGVYLVKGSLNPYGDLFDLINLHIPISVLLLAGLFLLLLFLLLSTCLFQSLGFQREESLFSWLLWPELGILIYFSLGYGFCALTATSENVFPSLRFWFEFFAFFGIISSLAVMVAFQRTKTGLNFQSRNCEAGWRKVTIIFLVAAVLTIAEVVFFGPQ